MFVSQVIVLLFALWLSGTDSSVILRDRRQVKEYLDLFRVAKRDVQPPVAVNVTQGPATQTTYDWHQWTKTYPTGAPGTQSTYDWHQHTQTYPTGDPGTRTTYDWHQWTKTYPTSATSATDVTRDPTAPTTESPVSTTTESHDYRCPAGKYTCKGTIGLCITLDQICDGKQDCPHRDDEDPHRCFPGYDPRPKAKHQNNFAGTGFMFNVKTLLVKASRAKLFNQFSDNVAAHNSHQAM